MFPAYLLSLHLYLLQLLSLIHPPLSHISTLSLHDALPISRPAPRCRVRAARGRDGDHRYRSARPRRPPHREGLMNSDATTQAALSGTVGGASRWMGRANPHRPQWRRTLRWLLGMQAYLGVFFWGIILLLEVLALLVASRFGPVQVSMFQFATHGALWFPFSMMIITSAAMITTHVAQGRTRRSFVQASLITAVVVAIVYGIIMTAGLALEGVVYDAFGWAQDHVAE